MVSSVNLPRQEKRKAERRKAHLGNGRGLFPGLPRNRGARQRLSALRHGDFCPWDRFFRARARASSPSRQVSPPFTRLVQPLKAAPRSGHGRLPKAPRVRRARPPRPRAPHPAPRYKRPGNAPSDRDGIGKNVVELGKYVKRKNNKFLPDVRSRRVLRETGRIKDGVAIDGA